ncbi:MAG TPA: radical SAM protein [Myxococcaceae bacterium]|nr:radical SAM protein [Myxococcaceae bacterium]
MPVLDPLQMYRLPWSLTDNPVAWLEPTHACSLACDGCYRQNVLLHKPMAEVEQELATFARLRKVDGYSIAGGEPLLHPEVVQIVVRVTATGRKANLHTNGVGLTRELLHALKQAGLVGLTFHVDTHQGRPGWEGSSEKDLNELRQDYADLVATEGGLACGFDCTVDQGTLEQVPDVLRWAGKNIDRVHQVLFLLDGVDAREVVEVIARAEPSYQPAAYLAGTVDPASVKWLLGVRVGDGEKIHGYLGPKLMEAAQVGHHLVTGRYLAQASPEALRAGLTALLASAPFDRSARAGAAAWLRGVAVNPRSALRTQHMQSVLIHAMDVGADSHDDVCDGSPEMTVHDGKLVRSCRHEELRELGQALRGVPGETPASAPAG